MREVDVDLLRTKDECACFVTIALSKAKHYSAGPGLFVARTLQKDEVFGRYYGRL